MKEDENEEEEESDDEWIEIVFEGDHGQSSQFHQRDEKSDRDEGEENRLLEQQILESLSRDPPRSLGRVMFYPWTDPSVKSLGDQKMELLTAFLISKDLGRTLILPRMRPFEFQSQANNLEWFTAEYLYEIDRWIAAGLDFREYAFFINPRVLKKIETSPLSQALLVDLLTLDTPPFSGPLSSIFDDDAVKVQFIVPDPVQFKATRFTRTDIKQKLGPGSIFSNVPFLVFSGVFDRLEIDFDSKEVQELEEALSVRSQPGLFVDQTINR